MGFKTLLGKDSGAKTAWLSDLERHLHPLQRKNTVMNQLNRFSSESEHESHAHQHQSHCLTIFLSGVTQKAPQESKLVLELKWSENRMGNLQNLKRKYLLIL